MRPLLTLATATTVHAGAFWVLVVLHPSGAPPQAPTRGTTELDLDLSEPARPDVPSASAAADPLEPARGETSLGHVATKVEPSSALPDRSLFPPLADTPLAPEPSPSAWSFSPSVLSIDPRAAVSPDMVAPPRAAGSTDAPRPSPASTTGGLAEGLAAQDVQLGLGHGGAVLSAAEAVTRSTEAPVEGGATFDVVVHADGAVVARLVGADHDMEAWARLADSLGHSIDPSRMRLPPGRGWHVVVRVEAKVKLPDGRAVRSLHGPRAGITPSVLQRALEAKPGSGSWGSDGRESAGDTETEPMGGALGHGHAPQGNAGGAAGQGLAQRVLPTPAVSVSGKICTASFGVSPAGINITGGCSPENIGSHGTRVVSGHVVSEGAL